MADMTLLGLAEQAANTQNVYQNQKINQMKMQAAQEEMNRQNQIRQSFANGMPNPEELYKIDPEYAAQFEQNQITSQANARNFLKGAATDLYARASRISDPAQQQAVINQYVKPLEPQLRKMGFPMNEPITLDHLKMILGTTPEEAMQAKVAEKRALDQYEHDFTPQTSPSGDVVFYDKKHPTAAPIFPQQAGGMQQPIGNAQQPQRPTNGLINIFEQPQQNLSPKSAQLQQEEAVKLSAEAEKLRQQQELERNKQDVALIQSEPEKLAGISKAAMNLQGLGENLNKYGEQVKSDWLPTDNSIAYNARQVLGSNTVLNDITQANGQIMVDTMRSMKQDSGVSPSQLMNTEKEWERQLAAATGQGTVESRKNAWEKLTRELHQTYNSYEKTRAAAYKRQNKEYKPLINADILPGAKVMEMDTNNMPIGQTGVLNGKKIRVIGQNQIEVID